MESEQHGMFLGEEFIAWGGSRPRTNDRADRIDENPFVNSQLMEDLQQQITDGTYETPERLDVVVDRLMKVIQEFNPEKVARVRQQIADGTYETPDKLDAVVDRLHAAIHELNEAVEPLTDTLSQEEEN